MRLSTTSLSCARGGTIRVVIWTLVSVILVVSAVAVVWLFRPLSTEPFSGSESDLEGGNSPAKGGHQFPDTAKTADEIYEETLVPWLEENWKVGGLPVHDGDGITIEEWRTLVEAMISEELVRSDFGGWDRLHELAVPHVDRANANPLAEYIVGRALSPEHPEKKSLLARAYQGFASAGGSEILAFHAAVDWALSPNVGETMDTHFVASAGLLDPEDPQTPVLDSLEKALSAHEGFSGFHDRLAGYLLLAGSRSVLFEYFHEPMREVISDSEQVEPWLKYWVDARHFRHLAWEARGTGGSGSVSSEGWALFHRNMKKGRAAIEKAWAEEPDHPGVAAEGVALALSQGDDTVKSEIDRWFKEAGKIQVDHSPVYSDCLWALRPRWHGSHREMQTFGKKCLDSGRFDSRAPWWFLRAHMDIASEWDLPSAYFPEMGASSACSRLVEGFENEPERESWRNHDRTHSVLLYFFRGDYTEAARWLALLGEEPFHRGALSLWGNPRPDWVIGKIGAYSGSYGKALGQAEEDELKFRSGEAYRAYNEVLNEGGGELSGLARNYINDRRDAMRVESQFREEGVVRNFLPGVTQGSGWRLRGLETGDGDELLFRGADSESSRATCEARIGPRFLMNGIVEAGDTAEGVSSWISFGYPERRGKTRWGAVEFQWYRGKTSVILRNGSGVVEENSSVTLEGANEFRLSVSPEGISLQVNGETVWNQVPVPRRFVKEEWAQVGYGARFGAKNGEVVFRGVSLERLPEEVE